MKKVFILATAAIVALASCAKTQVVYNDQPEEIAFKQITGAMTKATDLGDGVKMGVFADYNGTTRYFTNESFGMEMVDAVKVWAGDTPKYWPYEGTLDFTVYAPHGTATYNDNELNVTGVTASDALLYGEQRYCGKDKEDGNIPVVLKHACAKISVILKSNVADVFTVKDLTFSAVKDGDYTVDYGSGPSVTTTTGSPESYDLVTADIPLTTGEGTSLNDVYVLPGDQTEFNIEFYQAGITTFSKTIDLSGEKWVANYHYTYTITITADEILLDPEVAEWDTPLGDYNYGNADLN